MNPTEKENEKGIVDKKHSKK